MNTMKTIVAAAATWLALAGTNTAQAYTLLGAETLPVRDTAVDIAVGYPELRFGYHLPVLSNLQITPRMHFFYAGGSTMAGGTLDAGNFGIRIGADIKLNIVNSGNLHVAAIWKFGVPLNFTPQFSAGVQLGLPGGVIVDYEVTSAIRVIAGVHFQTAVYFSGDGVFNLPLVFELGADFDVTNRFKMGVTFEGGPSFYFSSGDSAATTGYVAGLLSLQYLL